MSDKRILMVTAENDSLPGAKVGGVGDVLRDLPPALIKKGWAVDTVIPSYGMLARIPNLESIGHIQVDFSGALHSVEVLKLKGKKAHADAYILHSPLFSPQGEKVYCHDSSDRPFATDATKFAFFSTAVATAIVTGVLPRPNYLHCHDWHSAFLLILIRFSPHFSSLSSIKTVYSIHNIAMQGVRPFKGDPSSFETWFPGLNYSPELIADRVVSHCVNPMRAAICLADKVHTVSPSYAKEILSPSDVDAGIYGGEGLEQDLQGRSNEGALLGILNGCEYPRSNKKDQTQLSKTSLVQLFQSSLEKWVVQHDELKSVHWLAEKRLQKWASKRKPGMLVTSVGRLTDQKARIFTYELKPGVTVLSEILSALGSTGCLVVLGSGSPDLERIFSSESAKHSNFIFLNGFSSDVASALYQSGDLFLMPSSFEPCGISQLLAMRSGQPCLVNRVGGLKDTVKPNKNGFAFEANNIAGQAKAMVSSFKEALRVYRDEKEIWDGLRSSASKVRFTWEKAATSYIEDLYT